VPTREIVMITGKNFIRKTLRSLLVEEIQASIPKDMLALRQTQKKI
jgi:oxidative stress regulatory protein oxyR